MTHDMRAGLGFSVLAAVTFGTSGTFATPLLAAGWSPAAVVFGRVAIGGLVLAVPAWRALRGRWHLVREDLGLLLGYGGIAVAFTQFAYFNAISHMDVAVALLVEYLAPVAVLGWLWAAHGQRPSRLTVGGSLLALAGLVLALDLFSGADIDPIGIGWALTALGGCTVYFVLSARPSHLPPTALAAGGFAIGAPLLLMAGVLGLVPFHAGAGDVVFRGTVVPWWLPLLGVGVISAALAYQFGIAGSRLLGSRLGSFVALLEVLAALGAAWLLLGQAPAPIQLVGGVAVLGGVVLVKLGEPAAAPAAQAGPEPLPVLSERPAA